MKHKMSRAFLRETGKIFTNGLFFKNPVLIGALGIFPVVAGGYSLRMAAELSLLFFFMALPAELILCGVGGLIPVWVRPAAVLSISALCYLPAAWATDKIVPGTISSLGIFASLMICNSMILSRANDYAPTHIAWAVLADVLGCSLGFAVLICGISVIREYLQFGEWNQTAVAYAENKRGMSLPFFGFILVGFFAALVQWINNRRTEKTANRRETHI